MSADPGRRISAITGGVLVTGLALLAPVVGDGPLAPGWDSWRGAVVVAVLFAAAEVAVVHVHVRRHAHTFSLAEVPAVLSVLLLSPPVALAVRLVGTGAALVAVRRQGVRKLAFNLALFTLDTAILCVTIRLLVGDGDPLAPVGWFAVGVGAALSLLAGAQSIAFVIAASEGRRLRGARPSVGLVGLMVTGVATLFALLAVVLLEARAAVWPLLLVAAVVVAGALRSHARLQHRHQSLQEVHGFTRWASASLEAGAGIELVLGRVCEVLRAEWAEVVTTDAEGRTSVSSTRDGVLTTVTGSRAEAALARHRQLLASKPSALVRDGSHPSSGASRYREAIVAALPGAADRADELTGTLLVADRASAVERFDDDDRSQCEALAGHLAVVLRKRNLFERLRIEAAERHHRALHDDLTGLPNRVKLDADLADLLADGPGDVGVLLVDLDRFKEVNDTLGHHHGDRLLVDVAHRVADGAPAGAVVARLGGDKFAVALRVRSVDHLREVAEHLLHLLTEPFPLQGLLVDVGASVGTALSPDHGTDGAALLQKADVAIYAAKEHGKGIALYDPSLDQSSVARLGLVAELRTAIDRAELGLVYQPVVSLADDRVVGVEALCRWDHPRHGPIAPDDFIAVAEVSGLIHGLTELVLERALRQLRDWRAAGHDLSMSVNLSMRSLLDDRIPTTIARLLEANGVPAGSLTLEITESTLMSDPARTIGLVQRLSAMGIRLSIDDFGTGYSSLSHLRRLPVDEVKIDRSFVKAMHSDDRDADLVQAIVQLAHNLGLDVVAEGVEDRLTHQTLRAFGCDLAQGFGIGRPSTATHLTRWLRSHAEGSEPVDLAVDTGPGPTRTDVGRPVPIAPPAALG